MDALNLFHENLTVDMFNVSALTTAYVNSIFSVITMLGLAIIVLFVVAFLNKGPGDSIVCLLSWDMFIINGVCLLTFPLWIYQAVTGHWVGGEFLCKFSGMFYTMSVYATVWSCFIVTFDRWYCLVKNSLRSISTAARTVRVNQLITIVMMFISFLGLWAIMETDVTENKKCYLYSGQSILGYLNACLGYFTPWLFMGIMLAHMTLRTKRLDIDPKWVNVDSLFILLLTVFFTQGPFYGMSVYMGSVENHVNGSTVITEPLTYHERKHLGVKLICLLLAHALALTRFITVPFIFAAIANYKPFAVWGNMFKCGYRAVPYEDLNDDPTVPLARHTCGARGGGGSHKQKHVTPYEPYYFKKTNLSRSVSTATLGGQSTTSAGDEGYYDDPSDTTTLYSIEDPKEKNCT
ncbi:G protein-coupled receptor-1 [Proboscivirus elephantidbeta4]|uniref:G protein-coupled receptor-1 n=1 Tax=Elephant endotheliotropic herpesvirus 4 TaxID=548914 RepID=A0A0S1TP84_9BETA|nr:G protein-coupled receptor-1 [Elephant endotheliotropic herpesvirus 4]ALM26002.1 G protein-coupled receptor-1 [Elephant endotheliotropic herpesvirus 4]